VTQKQVPGADCNSKAYLLFLSLNRNFLYFQGSHERSDVSVKTERLPITAALDKKHCERPLVVLRSLPRYCWFFNLRFSAVSVTY
jgi:hypothetical protein